MDNEEMLQKILDLAEDTNRKTRAMYRGYVWGSAWKVFYWMVIIGIGIGAFYYLQPYLNALKSVTRAFSSVTSTSTPQFDLEGFKRLVK